MHLDITRIICSISTAIMIAIVMINQTDAYPPHKQYIRDRNHDHNYCYYVTKHGNHNNVIVTTARPVLFISTAIVRMNYNYHFFLLLLLLPPHQQLLLLLHILAPQTPQELLLLVWFITITIILEVSVEQECGAVTVVYVLLSINNSLYYNYYNCHHY